MEQKETSPTSTATAAVAAAIGEPPLCVDLDGTLIATDSLWEGLLLLARQRPLEIFRIPSWMKQGKAQFKAIVSDHVAVDVSLLPYRPEVMDFLQEQKCSGRRLVLATASHRSVAEAVARHLGLFDEVIATEGANNLRGAAKLAALERRFGAGNFDYLGDSKADRSLWKAARQAYLVAPQRQLSRIAGKDRTPHHIVTAAGERSAVFAALRPHQWIKNLLVLLPLVFGHRLHDHARILAAFLAFFAYCLCASSVYIINDLLDLEADRRHPLKRRRPFASGELSAGAGLLLSVTLLIVSFAIAGMLPLQFLLLLALYLLLTTLYSFWLKRKLLIDVILLASLYTLRIIAGAAAIDVPMTMWLLGFSMFLFLSLAFTKRYSELLEVEHAGGEQIQWARVPDHRFADHRKRRAGQRLSFGPGLLYVPGQPARENPLPAAAGAVAHGAAAAILDYPNLVYGATAENAR